MNAPPPGALLGPMMTGYWVSQSIYVAAKLGLADLLAKSPQTADELAATTGMHGESLYRLLRALASVGVFCEDDAHRFAMTPVAELLRSGVPGSQRSMAIMMGEEHFASWGQVMHSIRTGQSGFEKVHGEPVFDWLSKHDEQAALFDQAMVSVHGRETAAMVEAFDFSKFKMLADVGGGNGSVLRGVLAAHPNLRGMLCDLAGVIERAKPLIAADKLTDRLQTVVTNFFVEVPAGADAYLMRHIIHDWDDDESLTILRNVRRAIGPDGRLLVVEGVIPPGNEPSFSKLLDLNMMVIPGGKERTESQYRELYQQAGFRLTTITPTRAEVSVIEGEPV